MVEQVYVEPYIYKTTDGGINWEELYVNEIDFDSRFAAVYFIDENTGWLVYDEGDKEIILQTTNGAQNWEKVWQSTKSNNNYSQYSFHFSNSVEWLVSTSGFIAKYTEENQWQTIKTLSGLRLEKVFFTDTKNGWILSYPEDDWWNRLPILLKTEDGGENWETHAMDYRINDLYFTDNLHGWAVGTDTTDIEPFWLNPGIILHTVDGGSTWYVAKDKINGALTDIHFKDGYLWAVGNNGLVLKTTDKITEVNEATSDKAPNTFTLSQNYPNPFNPTTTIEYHLEANNQLPVNVDLSIFNLLGQKVTILVSKKQSAGTHRVEWDASSYPSGVYVYTLETSGGFKESRKLVLLR